MTNYATTATMADLLRDLYPMPGSRIKQWVVDSRRNVQWERETCPKVTIVEHDDNTGLSCRNVGVTPWSYALEHDCCYVCNELGEQAQERADVVAWLAEKAARPPEEPDRDKYSDEIEPEPPPLKLPWWVGKDVE